MPFDIIKYWFQDDSTYFNGNSIQKNLCCLQIGGKKKSSTGYMISTQIYSKKGNCQCQEFGSRTEYFKNRQNDNLFIQQQEIDGAVK